MSADALADVSSLTRWSFHARPVDLYFCPHCGYKLAYRVRRDDLIVHCWGPCLELYGEPIPITFVRGIWPGRPGRELPF